MQFCNNCLVKIRGNKAECPLCGNTLPIDNNEQDELYPQIPLVYENHVIIRILIFLSIITVVVSFSFHQLFPTKLNWPILVVLGLLSSWLSLIFVIRKRHNMAKTILWQITIVSSLSIFWDFKIGWKGWSLDYVIPITCVVAMFVMYITAKVMKLSFRDYYLYFLLDGIFGIIPLSFILFHWINVLYPSIVCVGVSIIFLSAIIIFQGKNIKIELDKRMHI